MIVQVPNPTKAYLSFAMRENDPETVIVKSHVSRNAAKRAADANVAKLRKADPLRVYRWGWTEVTQTDVRLGVIL